MPGTENAFQIERLLTLARESALRKQRGWSSRRQELQRAASYLVSALGILATRRHGAQPTKV